MMHKLEKLNSSIDIIPLQSPSMTDTRRPLRPADRPGAPVVDDTGRIRDPLILSRVRTYLYENEDKIYIDVTEMAECLQRKYRDYRGKKQGPFRKLVRKAYDEITDKLTRKADTHWQDDDDEIDIESDSMIDSSPPEFMAVRRQIDNCLNGNSSDKELIDISSDDDQSKPASTYKAPKESVEAETTHVSKRTHLSPSIEPLKSSFQQQVKQVNKAPRESVEAETTHVSKRPHLSPSIEPVKSISQQQFHRISEHLKSRLDKSRKRPRDRDDDTFEPIVSKKKTKDLPLINSTVKFSNVGGNTKVLETVANLLLHMKHPEVYIKLGISPPRGVLLHGPPGCGKTLLAHAVAGELKIPLLKVAAPELVAGVSGESEQRIRELFDQAVAIAPCILFLDEIDSVAPHRSTAQKEMERRIVSQLLSCLDDLGMKENGNKVLVLGATNRPDSLDPALRRAGRFDREISLGIPDKEARKAILKIHTEKVTLSPEVNLQTIASLTPGFVGADLVALIREAAMAAVNRTFDELKSNANANKIPKDEDILQAENEKPSVPDADISDIIIEEELSPKKESKDQTDNAKETEDEIIPENAVKEQNKEDGEAEIPKSPEVKAAQDPEPEAELPSIPADVVVQSADTSASVAAAAEATATSIPDTEPTEVPVVTSESEPAPVSGGSSVEIQPDLEVLDRDQIDDKDKKLNDILGWLHNEPPLTPEQLALLCIEERDFELALKNVQPSAKREGFATVPDVTWDDVGSLQDIRQELQMTIMAPIRHSEHFASLGLTTPTGVLLCGPPGCGKTLLAKAIANEAGINFISVKGPELLNMYVGESEKAVRQCFLRARNSAPCVIFFDELDALCPKRSEGDSSATSRVVNQMLTEMDGVEGRRAVFLMAASNRPDIIDPAVLRPGRLDKILYVGLPNPNDRVDILRALTKNGTKPKLANDVNLEAVAGSERCIGYTGADLAALIREAGVEALREIMNGLTGSPEISLRHFEAAFDKVRPSVQEKDMRHYEKLEKLYSVKKCLSTDVPMSVEPPIDNTMEAMET